MPYIEQEKRTKINTPQPSSMSKSGDLCYALYKTCLSYLPKEPAFTVYCDILGALEACKQEVYRRYIAPYESEALARNGDVEPTLWD